MVVFLDGASHYDTSELGQKYSTKTDDGVTWAVVNEGRTDGCVRRTSVSPDFANGYLGITPLFNQTAVWTQTASGTFGHALKVSSLAAMDELTGGGFFNMSGVHFQVMNGPWSMFGLSLNRNGTFTVYTHSPVGGVNTARATSVQAITDDEWAYLEFQWALSLTEGSLKIKSNGNLVLDYTGVLGPSSFPMPYPGNLWNSVIVMGQNVGAADVVFRMCDVILMDRVPPNGDFLGDISIAYIKPDGVGASSQWTPSAGANWECVDEVPPNGDTDYVSAEDAGRKDTYEFEDVIGDPLAIQVCAFTKKEAEGGSAFSVVTRQDGSEYNSPVHGIGSTEYAYHLQPYDTNPHTGAQWTKAQMDAGQWGPLKVT